MDTPASGTAQNGVAPYDLEDKEVDEICPHDSDPVAITAKRVRLRYHSDTHNKSNREIEEERKNGRSTQLGVSANTSVPGTTVPYLLSLRLSL